MKILMPLFAHAHTKASITVIIPEEVESKGGKMLLGNVEGYCVMIEVQLLRKIFKNPNLCSPNNVCSKYIKPKLTG